MSKFVIEMRCDGIPEWCFKSDDKEETKRVFREGLKLMIGHPGRNMWYWINGKMVIVDIIEEIERA